MKQMTIRTESLMPRRRPDEDPDQLLLPMPLPCTREVYWLHGEQRVRRHLLGKRVVTRLRISEGSALPLASFVMSDSISELSDPDLRYALRFADAANAVGPTRDSEYSTSQHHVWVTATNEGAHSRLLEADYTGIVSKQGDTFMQNLLDAAPAQH